jgi:hypothetical protein
VLIHQIDHVELIQVHPDGPDGATVVFSLYTPRGVEDDAARRHFQANFDLLVTVSDQEDFRLGEGIQRGFHVPGNDRVVYGRNEPGVAHFHRMVNDCLGEGAIQAERS